ncbi:MAG: aminotransferase class I/II-fold pyridoxal phosphate-dependent enzyme, partial [Phycisphaera sp.]|nr:aminotransferase class I/II-fold pyridoxal phosphate-dependent enzyme [Phycisphaera sp.]
MNSTIQKSTTVGTPRIRLRLDANECADASFGRSSNSIGRYPTTAELEEAIAVRWRTQPDRIVVTAGADDAIDRICTAFLGSGSRVVMTDPTFCMIRRSCSRRTTDILSVPWLDDDFPVDTFIDSSRGCDLMVLVTPNNPTGSTIAYDDIERVRNENPDPILMVDLAYLEFATPGSKFGREEIVRRLRMMPRTVMVRTLSKAWGLAGLRVGWAETSPDLARLIRDAGGPFPVSSPSIAMATDVVCDPDSDSIVDRRVRSVAENRDSIERGLRGQEFDPGTSSANFVLVQDSERMGRVDRLSEGLDSLGISVRRFDEGSIRDRIRITVPAEPEHARRLCSCIDAIVDPDGLIFDLDGVLADVDGSYREAIRRTAADFGVRIDDEDVDRVKDIGFANDDWEVTRRILGDRGVVVEYD